MSDSPPLPATIHHYTSAEGLQGILGNRELWLTDIDFLNDEMEVRYALQIASIEAQSMIRAFEKSPEMLMTPRGFQVLEATVEKLNERLDLDEEVLSPWEESLFVASFCQSADLLSMWRAYGASAEGYSVEFDVDVLRDVFSEKPEARGLTPVEYDDMIATNGGLFGEISRVQYGTGPGLFGDALVRARGTQDDDAHALAERLRSELARVCALIKHPAFEEEDEVRLVIRPQGDTAPRPRLRSGGGHLLPYQVIRFPHEAVRSITVGPSRHRARNARAIHKFLDYRDRREYGHIEIKVSDTPLV